MDISSMVNSIEQTVTENSSRRFDSAIEDARYTLEKQIECAENRKRELIRAIYFNIIIFGSFVTLLSVSSPSLRISDLLWFIILSGFLWLLSTGIAIRGLYQSGLNVRYSIEGLDLLVNRDYTNSQSSEIQLNLYKEIIKSNENVGSKCGIYATISIILTIYTILIIGIGVFDTLITAVPIWVYLIITLLLIYLAKPIKTEIQRLLGIVEDEPEIHIDELLE